MCSILGILEIKSDPAVLRARALRLSKLQRHRGPEAGAEFQEVSPAVLRVHGNASRA